MGYGYAETFLIVFLTHPGVIIPTLSSVMGRASSFIPAQAMDVIPAAGIPPIISGLWQTMWVWILSIPGERSSVFGWTMYVIYLLFLMVYMYFILRLRISGGW